MLIAINAKAQDSTNKKTGIITKKTFGPYRMNGEKLSRKELKAELYKVPTAIPLYKKAKTSEILGASFIVPVALLAFLGDPNKYNYRDTVHRTRKKGFYIGLLLSEGASFYFFFHSISLYKKAIRARNSALKTIY
jgi:hypothetical protein